MGRVHRSRAAEGAEQGEDVGQGQACQDPASEQDPPVQPDRRRDPKESEEPDPWSPRQMVLSHPAQKPHRVWQVRGDAQGGEGEAGEPGEEGDGGGLHARGPDRQVHQLVHHEPEGADPVPGVRHFLHVRRLLDERAWLDGMEHREGRLYQQLL